MPSALRIVSYNVRYFGHALRGLASTRGSKRGVAEALASLDPPADIVCLQEVETISLRSSLAFRRSHENETQLEAFMAELEKAFARRPPPFPYDAFYFHANVNRIAGRPVQSMGLAILVHRYRLRIDAHNCESPENITWHHVLRWKDRKQTRICAHMKLQASGRPFHVFNTHLSLPTPFAKAFWTGRERMGFGVNQLHEAKTLAAFVRRQAGQEPYVVAGDFNSPPGSPVYRYLTEEMGLQGAQASLGQIDPREARAFPTAGFLRLRMHLDHLFSSDGLHWLDLDGTRRFGDKTSPFWGKSDHVPLIARFEL